MDTFRNRPKDDYIQNSQWQELHVLTQHWKSDLHFYSDDLKFLSHLLDKYFIWITKKDNLKAVRMVGEQVLSDIKTCKKLQKQIDEHLSHIAGILQEPSRHNSKIFRAEHQELEDKIAKFVKTVRKNRKQVFAVTTKVLDSEESIRLLER